MKPKKKPNKKNRITMFENKGNKRKFKIQKDIYIKFIHK